MAGETFEYLLERDLKEELTRVKAAVVRGDMTDYADYRYHVGWIRGIQFAMDQLAEVRQKVVIDEGFE